MAGDALSEKLRTIPPKPGVYQFVSGSGEVLYIGKAINLRNRVRQYFQKGIDKNPRLKAMTAKVADVEIIVTDSEVEALILETTLIRERKPRYNVDLKDDKSYPYIVITNEPYPRVFPTRRVIRDGSKYFGPFTDVKNMHSSLKMVRDMYRVRSCNFHIDDEAIRQEEDQALPGLPYQEMRRALRGTDLAAGLRRDDPRGRADPPGEDLRPGVIAARTDGRGLGRRRDTRRPRNSGTGSPRSTSTASGRKSSTWTSWTGTWSRSR